MLSLLGVVVLGPLLLLFLWMLWDALGGGGKECRNMPPESTEKGGENGRSA